MSLPERLLWQKLRGRTPPLKVRRQHPIGPYVADFYIAAAHLVVEIDGETHAVRRDRDAARDAYLAQAGYKVFRLTARDVLRDIDGATDAIIRSALPLHHAAVRRGPPPQAVLGEEPVGAR